MPLYSPTTRYLASTCKFLLLRILTLLNPLATIQTLAMLRSAGIKSKFSQLLGEHLLNLLRASKDAVLAYVEQENFSQVIHDAVVAAPDDAFFNWRLMFRNPTPNWVSPNGRVVQLGDAAHTFLPSSGNGATQALEDGICLAACLQLVGKSQIPLGVRVYNKLR